MKKKTVFVMFCILCVMTFAFAESAFAEPVVLKNSKTGKGTEVQRDRSLQDGTLVYSMTPVYPEDLKEGKYDTEALSSSQFFKIIDAELTNSDGRMSAVITLSSTSYSYVYPGTAAEAEAADKSGWIAADESSGFGQFALDVEALNKEKAELDALFASGETLDDVATKAARYQEVKDLLDEKEMRWLELSES